MRKVKNDFDKEVSRRGTNSIKWDVYDDPEVIGMGCADMDFTTAECISQALIDVAQKGNFNYHFKPDSYFQTIIDWYRRCHNCEIKKEWLCNSPGVFPTIRMCLQTYAKPGDRVIVQTPHFGPINVVVKHAGCELITNPMILKEGKFEIDFVDFEEKIKKNRPKIFLMINPHNPTGRVFTRKELLMLGEICKKYSVLMISDEVHGNIMYDDNFHSPLFSVSQEIAENCVVITAPSKGYNLMDLTYCILVIPNVKLRSLYEDSMAGFTFNFATNIFSVTAVQAAYSEMADAWLAELVEYLKGNFECLTEEMESIPQIKIIRPEGGFMVWLDCRELHMTSEELKDMFLKSAKVGLSWGEEFGSAGKGFERINIACTRNTLKEALTRIKRAINNKQFEL
ncbi:pyridoxal phosphate-dependent aminotransferase [Clostridiaceae bacterium Marseille-Q4143]|nr:pyridoxal phosphate-dependent aminotransferase [Clostridiaceae bacterium Marseille-Q4143]